MTDIYACYDPEFTEVTCGIDQVDQINIELQRLSNNTDYLKSIFEITRIGEALFICKAPVTGVLSGQPVFFDTTTNSFKPAVIAFSQAGTDIQLAPSCQVWGIATVVQPGADVGTILLEGIGNVDLTESAGSASPSGLFYLTRTLGGLSLTVDDAVDAPVLAAMGDGRVLFRPHWVSPHSIYRIRRIPLAVGPAGNAIVSAGIATISDDGDPDQSGWLPVTSPVFTGMTIPVGAKFGYNLPKHLELSEMWPPLPIQLATVRWQVDGDGRGGAGDVSEDLLRINVDNLWWMSDCNDQVPWSTSGPGSACGSRVAAALSLFLPVNIPNSAGRVTSLRSMSPGLAIYRRDTTTLASEGELDLALTTAWALGPIVNDSTGLAVKGIDTNGLLKRGPIVSGIKSLSASVTVQGTAENATGFKSGAVTITIGAPQDAELLPQRIALDGAATDESYVTSLAIGLPSGMESSIRSQFYIPGEDSELFYLVQYEYWLQAVEAGTLPALVVSGLAWQSPGDGIAQAPTVELPISAPVSGALVPANGYVRVVSEAFALRAGSVLGVKLLRSAAAGDRSVVQARVLKQLLRIIRPSEEGDSVDDDQNPPSGIYDTTYANQYG
jgi:hypothetical protein